MKAFILAAGRGERLRPLTDTTPKPLLQAGPHRLIEYHLYNLAKAGITEVVINTSWLREQFAETLGDGSNYQLNIRYSDEGDNVLETAGGIINALPLLGDEPFLVINGDIWTDFDLSQLSSKTISSEAHLVLVNNPDHNNTGDFGLDSEKIINESSQMYTYSGIGIYTAALFDGLAPHKTPLAPLLRSKTTQGLITGEHYPGLWTDVGTGERLELLAESLKQS